MSPLDPLCTIVVCPKCRADLAAPGESLRCGGCGAAFPSVGGIPCVFVDPADVIARWRLMIDESARGTEGILVDVLSQLAQADLLASTRERLERTTAALRENARRIEALLAASGLAGEPNERAGRAQVGPGGAPIPGERPLYDYYPQIHRDWGWGDQGDRENERALRAVQGVVGAEAALGKVLVLGAGACRLAHDLHHHYQPAMTVALDINPLPLLVAKRVMFDGPLPLFEFPLYPIDVASTCVDRALAAPAGSPERFHFLFADGLRPPVRPGSIDTVITPWFIDQVPKDVRDVIAVIHGALALGGRWVNFGPLVYRHGRVRASSRYCKDEVLELVAAAGFELGPSTFEPFGYLRSPAGTQGRVEQVLTFSATKVASDRPAPAPPTLPPWLVASDVPIPRFPGLDAYKAPHPMFSTVIAMIDGRRTLADIARLLIEGYRVPERAAENGVRACLTEIHRACGG